MHIEVADPGQTICPRDRSRPLKKAEQANKDPGHKKRPLHLCQYLAERTSVNETNSFLRTQLGIVFSDSSNSYPIKENLQKFSLGIFKVSKIISQ